MRVITGFFRFAANFTLTCWITSDYIILIINVYSWNHVNALFIGNCWSKRVWKRNQIRFFFQFLRLFRIVSIKNEVCRLPIDGLVGPILATIWRRVSHHQSSEVLLHVRVLPRQAKVLWCSGCVFLAFYWLGISHARMSPRRLPHIEVGHQGVEQMVYLQPRRFRFPIIALRILIVSIERRVMGPSWWVWWREIDAIRLAGWMMMRGGRWQNRRILMLIMQVLVVDDCGWISIHALQELIVVKIRTRNWSSTEKTLSFAPFRSAVLEPDLHSGLCQSRPKC